MSGLCEEIDNKLDLDNKVDRIFVWFSTTSNAPCQNILKGILRPKMKILLSFTHPQVVANLYEFMSSADHKGRYFEERLEL